MMASSKNDIIETWCTTENRSTSRRVGAQPSPEAAEWCFAESGTNSARVIKRTVSNVTSLL